MSKKESQDPEFTLEDVELLRMIKANPVARKKLPELMERFNSEVDGGMDAYDAELLITELTKELGKGLIGDWAEKSQESVIKRDTKFSNIVKNGKKNATGIPPSGA